MSETSAKSIRAAREAKAKRLGSAGDPKQKVDASSWTPPEMMNTSAKTGLRPVSRRAYKRGGKVGMEAEGSCGPTRADRKPRKSGGEAKAYMAAKINRDVKEANAELGKPHIGGMKKGGRAKRQSGGMLPEGMRQGIQTAAARGAKEMADEMAMRQLKRENPPPPPPSQREKPLDDRSTRDLMNQMQDGMKKGGRAKKMGGGMSGDPRQGAAEMMQKAAAMGNVPADRMGFSRLQKGRMAQMTGLKKGGKVSHQEWEHSKADLKQDKKLAKKHGMSMEKWEGSKLDEKHDKQQSAEGLKKGGRAKRYAGGKVDDRVHKLGGGTLSPRRAPQPEPEIDPRSTFLGRVGRGSWSERRPPGTLVQRGVPEALYQEQMAASAPVARRTVDPVYTEEAMQAAYPNPLAGMSPTYAEEAMRGGMSPMAGMTPDYAERMAAAATRAAPARRAGPSAADRLNQAELERVRMAGLDREAAERAAAGAARAPQYSPETGAQGSGNFFQDLGNFGRALVEMPARALGYKKGGKVMEGNYTGGTRPTGGRIAKKGGGRAKGKTNIIISINPGAGAAQQQGMMPPGNLPPGAGGRPGAGAMPVPVAGPPGAGAPPPMPMPIPMPMPMGAGAGGPPMPPPGMPRKAGGRAYRSYKDMDAGAASGLGRLEKTEIAEHQRGARKAGGRTYRSYKDMDAGAGSGLGRLEKTEIQARKS
jgi:hypothetical protein